ncbi:MAG TPA: tRNA uridine-5-carboxymethylaminomethyl(34) synthesis GTPase MnmE [Methylomirabilota bacterium]|nr:tRNA uridine-5-carboxymethylaminomethyl(34) synthesis GTPase MnmE [Methylomirabilota bacterium]
MTLPSPSSAADDPIVAIATPPGRGAIGVIRISGRRALAVASTIVRLDRPGGLVAAPSRRVLRARIVEPDTGAPLDEALVVAMPGPRSYTGQDVVELSCHGNPILLAEIVGRLVAAGARLAAPGEFTRRAYLNGRLDLVQAEAVAELIAARTDRAVRLAARQLRGTLASEIGMLREWLLDLVAGLEVALDFPEDEIGLSRPDALKRVLELAAGLEALAAGARRGRAIQEGLRLVLTGTPNVGKSSLLNALLGAERAIVSPAPGTTRDLVEGELVIAGIAVRLVDGAGLGAPSDAIDAEGMRRARTAVAESDLVVVVLDRSRPLGSADLDILAFTEARERLLVANKSDLPAVWDEPSIEACVCSAVTGAGLDHLRDRIREWVERRTAADGDEGGIVASLRVVESLDRAVSLLRHAAAEMESVPFEAVLVDLREALTTLGQTLGLEADDAVLDRIFSRFCVGK